MLIFYFREQHQIADKTVELLLLGIVMEALVFVATAHSVSQGSIHFASTVIIFELIPSML